MTHGVRTSISPKKITFLLFAKIFAKNQVKGNKPFILQLTLLCYNTKYVSHGQPKNSQNLHICSTFYFWSHKVGYTPSFLKANYVCTAFSRDVDYFTDSPEDGVTLYRDLGWSWFNNLVLDQTKLDLPRWSGFLRLRWDHETLHFKGTRFCFWNGLRRKGKSPKTPNTYILYIYLLLKMSLKYYFRDTVPTVVLSVVRFN